MDRIRGGILGAILGDAIGVPVEFRSREYLKRFPVIDMRAFGTHHQPKGTWSDDSSLMLCLIETIVEGFDINLLGQKFIDWKNEGYWTPHGKVFDIGFTTRTAIDKIKKGYLPQEAGGKFEDDNGNGSLMRILPVIFFIEQIQNEDQRFQVISDISSITHGHIRSILACKFYVDYALKLWKGEDKLEAYQLTITEFLAFIDRNNYPDKEKRVLTKLLDGNLTQRKEEEIGSSGYVVSTLIASMWSFLRSNSYKEAVLTAVNLGEDTDTTGIVTGGLAGLYYGVNNIPEQWIKQIVKIEEIEQLIEELKLHI
jgi:ADP-ribosylglycohydrolase